MPERRPAPREPGGRATLRLRLTLVYAAVATAAGLVLLLLSVALVDRALSSGRLDLPPELPLLQDPDSRVVVVTASGASLDGCAAHVEYLRSQPVDIAAALATLRAEHGVRSILCEGGPLLNASLLSAGLVDELFLTTVPKLAGGAGALTIIGPAPLDEPLDAQLRWLLECDGELFARYRIAG